MLHTDFLLDPVEYQSRAVKASPAVFVFAVRTAQWRAEHIPSAYEIGKRGIESFELLADFGRLFLDLCAVETMATVMRYA